MRAIVHALITPLPLNRPEWPVCITECLTVWPTSHPPSSRKDPCVPRGMSEIPGRIWEDWPLVIVSSDIKWPKIIDHALTFIKSLTSYQYYYYGVSNEDKQ